MLKVVMLSASLGIFSLVSAPLLAETWKAGVERSSSQINVSATAVHKTAPGVQVDERALRYYAQTNQHDRVQAETRRLRLLHPEWTVATDLYDPVEPVHQALWDLYESERLEELSTYLEALKIDRPSFRPTPDFLEKYQAKRTRIEALAALQEQNWSTVIQLLEAQYVTLKQQMDLESLWALAKAHALKGDTSAAAGVYRDVIGLNTGAALRHTNLLKALTHLPVAEAEALADENHLIPGGLSETAFVRQEVLRRRLFEAVSAHPTTRLDASTLAAFVDLAKKSRLASDLEVMGWYHFGLGEHDQAAAWFDQALQLSDNSKTAEGLSLSYLQLGQSSKAFQQAMPWLQRGGEGDLRLLGPAISALVGDGKIKPSVEQLNTLTHHALNSAEPDVLEMLGWHLLRSDQYSASIRIFEKLSRDTPKQRYFEGWTAALRKSGNTEELKRVVTLHEPQFPDLAIQANLKPRRQAKQGEMATARKAGQFDRCIRIGEERLSQGSLSADGNLLLGWCLLDAQYPAKAAGIFGAIPANLDRISQDASFGKALALLRVGQLDSAYRIAKEQINVPLRQNEIMASALSKAAAYAFSQRDYAHVIRLLDERVALMPEPRDLALLRGWSHYHVGRKNQAAKIFTVLHGIHPTRSTRVALATIAEESGNLRRR